MPLVSIIVPVYNSKPSLEKCLRSLCKQTLSDIEVIMVNDGSLDESEKICDSAALLDGRIRVLHQNNQGSTASRKTGLYMALGKYVTFVDSDDWIEADLCEKLYNAAERSGAEIAIGEHFFDTDKGTKRQKCILEPGIYDREAMKNLIIPKLFHNDFYSSWSIYPYLCGKLFLRQKLMIYMQRVMNGITLGDDVCVTFPYLLECQSMVMVDSPLYHYVQRLESQSHGRMNADDLQNMRYIYSLVYKTLEQNELAEAYGQKLQMYMLTTMLVPRFPWLLSERLRQLRELPLLNLPRGSKVIIYGAGVFGRALYDFLTRNNFAKVVLWLDARAEQLRENGYKVKTLQEIKSWPVYDFVAIPIMNKVAAESVSKDLMSAGVRADSIRKVDEGDVKSRKAWQMFAMETEDA